MVFSNYEIHTNVSGVLGLIDKLQTFAVSLGWQLYTGREGERYEQETSPYGWQGQADTYYSLFHLASPGWGGNQGLLFRFMSHNYFTNTSDSLCGTTGHCAQDYRFRAAVVQSTDYDAESRYSPLAQTGFTYATNSTAVSGLSVPHDSPIPRVYIFGDDKFIWVTISQDGVLHQHLHFGSMTPLNATMPTNRNLACHAFSTMSSNSYDNYYIYGQHWSKYKGLAAPYNTYPKLSMMSGIQPLGGGPSDPTDMLIWNGEAITTKDYYFYRNHHWSSRYYHTNRDDVMDPDYNDMCIAKTIGGRYNLMKTVFAGKRDDGFIEPFASSPFYSCNCQNQPPGTVLSYGEDKFMVFPDGTLESPYWFAIKIQ